jgi:cytochrome c peroxidase
MWDGRATSVDDQIHMPLEDPREMNIDWPTSLEALSTQAETARYLGVTGKRTADRDTVIEALAAYVKSLVTMPSSFDHYYYQGDEAAIDQAAKAGFRIFDRKARCTSCHLITGSSAPLTDYNFHTTGIGFEAGRYRDKGRFEVTQDPADIGAFKTPSLRNVGLRPYFMHDGSFSTLREVIEYYNRGGNAGAPNMDGRVHRLYLATTEMDELLAFLETLSSAIVSAPPPQAAPQRQR